MRALGCTCPSCTRPLAPSGASQWETVCHALVSALPRRSPCPPRRLCSGPRPGGGCRCSATLPGLLPARFGLVVWIGVLEVRGWFPIQLQHDPAVQPPNHQSKPARRVPKKGRVQAVVGQEQIKSFSAKSLLPFSKHRSRDALRAGLVAIRSRQRVSERRSPEQGENGSAGCWPQKIHDFVQSPDHFSEISRIFR